MHRRNKIHLRYPLPYISDAGIWSFFQVSFASQVVPSSEHMEIMKEQAQCLPPKYTSLLFVSSLKQKVNIITRDVTYYVPISLYKDQHACIR